MIDFERSLINLDKFCAVNSINYAVIGGIAVLTYGYQRTTKDIDITVLCQLDNLQEIHKKFLKEYLPVFDDSLEFLNKNFILPVTDKITGVKIDIAAGLTIFDQNIIERRRRAKIASAEYYVCTLEDLIIYKLFADRHQDRADVQNLLEQNINSIDKNYLIKTTEQFRQLDREDMIVNLNKFL